PALRAAFWMSGALVSFMAMAIAGRELSTELTTFQILFFRSLIGLVVVAALLQHAGWKQIRTNVFGAHVLRLRSALRRPIRKVLRHRADPAHRSVRDRIHRADL